jgi:DNA-binding transcriptional LysR family regulator
MLNVRQVEAFRATVLAGSVSGAARMLHISQPSVSRLLSDLERHVGFKLFNRSGRSVVASPEGQLLFDEVERVFVGLSEVERTAKELKSLARGRLRVAMIPALAVDAASDIVDEFFGSIGRVPVTLEVQSSHRILEWTRARQIDLGLVNFREIPEDVECIGFWKYRCVCLIPAGHNLASGDSPLDMRTLAKEDIISAEAEFMTSISPDRDTADVFRRSALLHVGIWPAAPSFVRRRMGIAIVDPFTARAFSALPDLLVRTLVQDLLFEVALIRPAGRQPSLTAQKFTEVAASALARWEASHIHFFE